MKRFVCCKYLYNCCYTHCKGDRFKFDKSNVLCSSINESSNKFLELTVDNIPSSDL